MVAQESTQELDFRLQWLDNRGRNDIYYSQNLYLLYMKNKSITNFVTEGASSSSSRPCHLTHLVQTLS